MKRERPPSEYLGGFLHVSLEVKPGPNEPASGQIPFEVWIYQRNVPVPLVVVNPSLEITLFRAMGGGGWDSTVGVRLPIMTGDIGETGGLLDGGAVVWHPFASLSSELVLRLDALRHSEHGLRASLRFNAAVIPLGQARTRHDQAVMAHPCNLPWSDAFVVTNETWRQWLTMMGHPRPRVFELHPLSFSDLAEFEIACGKLRDAERQFFLGHWGQSIALSRSVVEAIFRHLGHKGKEPYDWPQIEAAGLPKEMAALFRAFNNVTNLENHPTGDHGWRRAEARFVLQMAASLAEYAGTLPPK